MVKLGALAELAELDELGELDEPEEGTSPELDLDETEPGRHGRVLCGEGIGEGAGEGAGEWREAEVSWA